MRQPQMTWCWYGGDQVIKTPEPEHNRLDRQCDNKSAVDTDKNERLGDLKLKDHLEHFRSVRVRS